MTVQYPAGMRGRRFSPRRATPLTRAVRQMRAPNEQKAYNTLIERSLRAARRAASNGGSIGRISPAEKRAIGRAAKATRLITTPGEARGVKKNLRRKARRS